MSTTEISTESSVTRLSSFQALEAGMFWRSLQRIEKNNIEKDEVLLVQNLKYVDNKIHTVVVRIHPDKINTSYSDTVRFHINDFLRKFKYEPDGEAIRKKELATVQGRINKLQEELLTTQDNPEKLKEIILQESQNSNLLTSGHSSEDILQQNISTKNLSIHINKTDIEDNLKIIKNESLLAEAKSQWIIKKTEEISKTINAMTPYFKEQAATAIAKTEDTKKHIKKLINGIESLELYIGQDVIIHDIKKGESAPEGMPLTIMQRKLVADEELAVFLDINKYFDFRDIELLGKTLQEEPAFIEQIFPTERCVLLMATTRRYIDYKDKYYNDVNNYENRKVFLLVRDGENIYQVYSPVESHLQAYHLFPTQKEVGKIFQGIDGKNIQYEDVNFSEHEDLYQLLELHYKRFLLLLCGLDHHHQLFGKFYAGEPSFDFMSLEFQQENFNFLRDDDDSYALDSDTKVMHVYDWIKNCNKQLRSGSRVLCINDALIDSFTAPGAFNRKLSQLITAVNKTDLVIARKKKKEIVVTIPAAGSYADYSRYNETREVNLEVKLPRPGENDFSPHRQFLYEKETKLTENAYSEVAIPYLCLDSVSLKELEYYIYDRKSRFLHLNYIRAFKEVLKILKEEQVEQSDIREEISYILDYSISSYKISEDKKEKIVSKVINIWRADHRGAKLPDTLTENDQILNEIKKLLEAFYYQEYYTEKMKSSVVELCKNKTPLRLTLNGKGDFYLYTKLPAEKVTDDLIKNIWVNRSLLVFNKEQQTFSFKNYQNSFDTLSKIELEDQIIFDWPEAQEFTEVYDFNLTYKEREDIINTVNTSTVVIKKLFSSERNLSSFIDEYFVYRDILNADKKRYVESPYFFIPLATIYYERDAEWRYLGIKITHFEKFLYEALDSKSEKDIFLQKFCEIYKNTEYARSLILGDHAGEPEVVEYQWSAMEIKMYNRSKHQGFISFSEATAVIPTTYFCANTIAKKFELLQKMKAHYFNALHFYANSDVIKIKEQEKGINICEFIGSSLFNDEDDPSFIPYSLIEVYYNNGEEDLKILTVARMEDYLDCHDEIRDKMSELKKIFMKKFADKYHTFDVSSHYAFYKNEEEAVKRLNEKLEELEIKNEISVENKSFTKAFSNF